MVIPPWLSRPVSLARRSWAGIATALVILCTWIVLTRRPAPAAIGHTLPAPDTRPYHAYVVLQPQDCSSSLEFLRVFARPRVRAALGVTGLVSGSFPAGGFDDVARRFRDLTGKGDLQTLSRETARTLDVLGFRATPFLIVLDQQGRVRFSAAAPASFEAVQHLNRLLLELASSPPEEG